MKLKPYHVASTDPTSIFNNIVIFQDRTVTQGVTLNGAASVTEVQGIVRPWRSRSNSMGTAAPLTLDQVIADNYLIDGGGGGSTSCTVSA